MITAEKMPLKIL